MAGLDQAYGQAQRSMGPDHEGRREYAMAQGMGL
jgi:hypothetical protein